ncbi:hypothetical protein DRN79_00300 [Methanosarcinales archaeon]|nr:MAG: hypothetical protein DRN79_00300 [Methanosarcinales archaeon]
MGMGRDLRKWQGIEQEFRVGKPFERTDIQTSIALSMNLFDALKNHKFFGYLPAIIHSKDYDGFLRNGSRIYLCNFSFEIATPECRNAYELLKYDKAMEFYVQIAAERVNSRGEKMEHGHGEKMEKMESGGEAERVRHAVQCWRANTELHPAFTRGTHENYSVSRDFNKEHFIPFLIIKPIFFGAGGYVSKAFCSMRDMIESAEYVISPRAIATKHIYGGAGVRKHPLFSMKGISNMRIHIDSGEGLRVEIARFLNNAITSFVIHAIEEGIMRDVDDINEPIETFRTLSRNTEGDWKLKTKSGTTINAMDIMSSYIDAIENLFDEKTADNLDIYALKTFERIHDKMSMGLLEDDFLMKSVEWLLKLNIIERGKFIELDSLRESVDYAMRDVLEKDANIIDAMSERDKMSDATEDKMMKISACFAFSNVCDEDFYESVACCAGVERMLTDEEIGESLIYPPPESRGALRVMLLDALRDIGIPPENILVRWNRIVCPPTRDRVVDFDDLDEWSERKMRDLVKRVRETF